MKKKEEEEKPKVKKTRAKKTSAKTTEAKPKKPRAKKAKVKEEPKKEVVEEVETKVEEKSPAPKKYVATIKTGEITVDEKYRREIEVPTVKGPVWMSFCHVNISAPTDLVCSVCPYFGKCNSMPNPNDPGNPTKHFTDYCGELEGLMEEIPAKGSIEEAFGDWPEFGFKGEE